MERQRDIWTLFTVTDFGNNLSLSEDSRSVRDDPRGVLDILLNQGVTGWELWSWLRTGTAGLSGQTPEEVAAMNPARVELPHAYSSYRCQGS